MYIVFVTGEDNIADTTTGDTHSTYYMIKGTVSRDFSPLVFSLMNIFQAC
jgi:hypothetical protein